MLSMKREINITLVLVRTSYLFIFFCLLALNVAGKQQQHYQGWLLIDNKKTNFSIDFSIAKNNLISGTSLTAKGTKDETKCKIKGTYNKKNKSILFYETVVISSKAKYKNLNFCLLVGNLQRTETAQHIKYTGKVAGYIRGTKTICAQGKIHLETKKTKTPIPSKPIPKSKPPIKTDTLLSYIAGKKVITYQCKDKKISLEVWDDIKADGDRIDIYLDGKKIVSNYELSERKKSFPLNLTGTKHTLKVVALNEGLASPNTSTIVLHTATIKRRVVAHIKEGEEVYISLKK